MKQIINFSLLILLLLGAAGCSTDIDINAPEKDIWVVYGILHQADSIQDIRISRAFLSQSNALDYAKVNDLSSKGLRVTLTDTNGDTREAMQIDSVTKIPEDGIFFPTTTVYRFDTGTGKELEPGMRYSLKVQIPGNDNFSLQSYTYVPRLPDVTNPVMRACPGGLKRYKSARLDANFNLTWGKGKTNNGVDGRGLGFEVKVYFTHRKENGPMQTMTWGPSPLIIEKQGCSASGSQLCYRFQENELITHFLDKMQAQPNDRFYYEKTPECALPIDLPKSFGFEITAVDTALSTFMQINDPKFTDFNTVRPPFSNMQGSETVIGIFGSTSKTTGYSLLTDCTEFLLQLNDTPSPGNCTL